MKLEEIQQALKEEQVDAWLFFDHHRRDPIAYRVLGLSSQVVATRRWYYMIPASGEPTALVHRIEPHSLDGLPGNTYFYASWTSQIDGLRSMLSGKSRVAMQYSPNCAIPYVANVDAGTVELVRSMGPEVVSSADLVQNFEARWTEEQISSHFRARDLMDPLRAAAFALIRDRLRDKVPVTEYEVQQFLLENFKKNGLVTDHGPIVAVDENASDPHYEPIADGSRSIRWGNLVLIDMWAKCTSPNSVYYDITWTAYCGEEPSDAMHRVFQTVRRARDRGVQLVNESVEAGSRLMGFEVDDAVRQVVAGEGFSDYFFHRTGHSIGEDVHGSGANMDNLETHDERLVSANTCFSIEPGIYLPEFGIRSEVNVLVGERQAVVTGEAQQELLRLF